MFVCLEIVKGIRICLGRAHVLQGEIQLNCEGGYKPTEDGIQNNSKLNDASNSKREISGDLSKKGVM